MAGSLRNESRKSEPNGLQSNDSNVAPAADRRQVQPACTAQLTASGSLTEAAQRRAP
jgi:hypothetical protein